MFGRPFRTSVLACRLEAYTGFEPALPAWKAGVLDRYTNTPYMPPETRFGNDKATMQKLQTLSDGKFNETKGVWSLGCPTNGWGSWIRTNERTGLDGVKVRCLTAWRYPNMIKVSSESTLRKMTEFACHDLKCANACFSELVTRKKAPRAFCRDSCCSAIELGPWRRQPQTTSPSSAPILGAAPAGAW